MQRKNFSGIALFKSYSKLKVKKTCQFLCVDMPYFCRPGHKLHINMNVAGIAVKSMHFNRPLNKGVSAWQNFPYISYGAYPHT